MAWEIEFTEAAEKWLAGLPAVDQDRIERRLEQVRVHGPALGRPSVDSIKGSRHRNMKELRVPGKTQRLLFAFDPRQRAIMLVGGDKAGREKRWYRSAVKAADRLMDDHLRSTGKETTWQATRAGTRSAGLSR